MHFFKKSFIFTAVFTGLYAFFLQGAAHSSLGRSSVRDYSDQSERYGITLAKQIFPQRIVDWMKTRLVPKDLERQLDEIFTDPEIQEMFARKELNKLEQEKGFIVLNKQAIERGNITQGIICKHIQVPGYVIKIARGLDYLTMEQYLQAPLAEGDGPMLLNIGRVWLRDLIEQMAQAYGCQDIIECVPKGIYCAPKKCDKRMAIMVIAQESNPTDFRILRTRLRTPAQSAFISLARRDFGGVDDIPGNIVSSLKRLTWRDTEPHFNLGKFHDDPFKPYVPVPGSYAKELVKQYAITAFKGAVVGGLLYAEPARWGSIAAWAGVWLFRDSIRYLMRKYVEPMMPRMSSD